MYAYAEVFIERAGVRALPLAAVASSGDQTYCWAYENGHAVRTAIKTGVSDGKWIEVINRRLPASRAAGRTTWFELTNVCSLARPVPSRLRCDSVPGDNRTAHLGKQKFTCEPRAAQLC